MPLKQLVDTVLLKSYLITDEKLVMDFLQGDNFCDVETCEVICVDRFEPPLGALIYILLTGTEDKIILCFGTKLPFNGTLQKKWKEQEEKG